ncbi:MAG TPA: hypothetical protein VLL51_08885 [Gemmatimonadales bacterium]|nr:hypothetical protein [Gemmatimonadales bacterium]
MRFRAVLGALAGAALSFSVASAQDAPPPPVFQMMTLELEPGGMIAWRDGLRKQAAAAKALNLSAAEVGWWAMNDNNRTIIVWPASRDQLFSNRQVMQKIRAADSAAAAGIAAAFQGGRVVKATNEIIQLAPNLSYQPATPLPNDQFGGVVIQSFDVAPGQGQAFNQAIQAINKAMADLKYPYARNLYRVRMGEGRTQIYTFIDNRENYYGKNSVMRLMEGNPAAAEALRTAYQAMLKTVSHMETGWAGYASDLSYPPPM